MLRSLFLWLDTHAWSYWAVALAVTAAYLGWLAWSLHRAERRPAPWADALALAAMLVAWRWPWLLLATELNPDESQLLAGALTLAHDPVFWRSVDGTTSGPLNFYVLTPLAWFGWPFDYFTGRLAALMMVWIGLVSLRRGLEAILSPAAAACAAMPAVAFFATTTEGDFLHHSSEHLTLALLPLAAALILRASADRGVGRWSLPLAAGVAGLLPWSKLQAAPLGAVLVLWAAAVAARHSRPAARRVGAVLAAGAAPSLCFLLLAAGTGQWNAMWLGYLLQNFTYIEQARDFVTTIAGLWQRAGETGQFPLFVALQATIIAAGLADSRRQGRSVGADAGWLAVLTVVAFVAVLVPRRDFLHYLLLPVFPLALLGGAAWRGVASAGSASAARPWVMGAAGILAVVAAWRTNEGTPPIFGQFLDHWRRPCFADGAVLRELARPGERLAIWGWSPRTHVESGLPQATRDAHTVWMIEENPRRVVYRQRFLADIQRARPEYFLDATGPGAFVFDRRDRHAHETFPELAEWVARDYSLLGDWGFARLYARNDHIAARRVSVAEVSRFAERGRRPTIADVIAPDRQSEGVSPKRIDGREALMLLPPATLEWRLDPTVRGVAIEYGVDPTAIAAGQTDGVELLAELVEGDLVRLLHRHWLRPVQLPDDAVPQRAEIPLPPLGAAAVLRVRSTPGPDGDAAWDWLYVRRVLLQRSRTFRSEQFPGFSRPPESAEAPYSSIVDDSGGRLLVLHSPSRLDFRLTGTERSLRFAFGLLPGAWSGGGQSDGVDCIVELHAGDSLPRVLLQRRLDPARTATDRGDQTVHLELPALRRGDVLRLVIAPGEGGPAWDWAYVRRWELF